MYVYVYSFLLFWDWPCEYITHSNLIAAKFEITAAIFVAAGRQGDDKNGLAVVKGLDLLSMIAGPTLC